MPSELPIDISRISLTERTESGKKMPDFDYLIAVNVLCSWAILTLKHSLEKEERRTTCFKVWEGEELVRERDSVILGDMVIGSLLRSIFRFLIFFGDCTAEDDREIDTGIEEERQEVADRGEREGEKGGGIGAGVEGGARGEGGEDDDDKNVNMKSSDGVSCDTLTNEIANIKIINVSRNNDNNDHDYKQNGMINYKNDNKNNKINNTSKDTKKIENILQPLLCLCFAIQGSGDILQFTGAELLSPTPHENLLKIRNFLSESKIEKTVIEKKNENYEEKQENDNNNNEEDISRNENQNEVFLFPDLISDLNLTIFKQEKENKKPKKTNKINGNVKDEDTEKEFKQISISFISIELASKILKIIELLTSEKHTIDGDEKIENKNNENKNKSFGEKEASSEFKIRGREKVEIDLKKDENEEKYSREMRERKAEKVTVSVIAFCRIWSSWPESRISDGITAHGLIRCFRTLGGSRDYGVNCNTIDKGSEKGRERERGSDRGSDSTLPHSTSSPLIPPVPHTILPEFQFLSSTAFTAMLPVSLRLIDSFRQEDKCLGKYIQYVQHSAHSTLVIIAFYYLI
jgi:hypothetical protein